MRTCANFCREEDLPKSRGGHKNVEDCGENIRRPREEQSPIGDAYPVDSGIKRLHSDGSPIQKETVEAKSRKFDL